MLRTRPKLRNGRCRLVTETHLILFRNEPPFTWSQSSLRQRSFLVPPRARRVSSKQPAPDEVESGPSPSQFAFQVYSTKSGGGGLYVPVVWIFTTLSRLPHHF